MKKHFKNIAWMAIATVVLALPSCKSDKNSPGYEYMPDMYRTQALEAYQEYGYFGGDSMATRKPVEGTIPQGYTPYMIPNTPEGYQAAAELDNPIEYSPEVVSEGKEIYGKMCSQCHGKKGKGDGPVATNPNWPGPPPAYDGRIKDLPAGQIFHSITYGKNMMGAHASQISYDDRWKLVYYIQKLQGHDLEAMHNGAEVEEEVIEEPVEENVEAETASI